jgi:hypothetical protein
MIKCFMKFSLFHYGFCIAVALTTSFLLPRPSAIAEDDVVPWEFMPYKVELWCAFDPSLEITSDSKDQLVQSIQNDLQRVFQATWDLRIGKVDNEIHSRIVRDLGNMKAADLTGQDLVVVIAKSSEQAAKNFEAAIEKYPTVAITQADKLRLDKAIAGQDIQPATSIGRMLGKLQVVEGGVAAIQAGMADKSIAAALVPRRTTASLDARPIPTPLPWQLDVHLRSLDKVFLIYIGRSHEGFFAEARELDCPMQYLGPGIHRQSASWQYLSRTASKAIADAFAPVARVEEAERRFASLRLRAGGLIGSDNNPAQVRVGDLMHPILRRDDRNGLPIVIEPIPWTYAAITSSDGVKMKANVYTYSGGPGVGVGKNRRVQSVVLRIRPQFQQTEVQLSARDSKKPLAACEIYLRDLESDEMQLLGRSDWRGRFIVKVPAKAQAVMPEHIRAAKAAAELKARIAKEQAEAAEQAAMLKVVDQGASDTPEPKSNSPVPSPPPTAPPAVAEADPQATVPIEEAKPIQLLRPLMKLYVKSGDVVLAQLPLAPGVNRVETAELPDDSRRLEAEGLMNGFQGDVLSLIGTRTLLAARIRLLLRDSVTRNSGITPEEQKEIWDKKVKEAETLMIQLRALPDYSNMINKLDSMQKKVLDESSGSLSLGAKSRIDKLFQLTREMLQKFLQDNTVRDVEMSLTDRQKGLPKIPAEAVTPPADSNPN